MLRRMTMRLMLEAYSVSLGIPPPSVGPPESQSLAGARTMGLAAKLAEIPFDAVTVPEPVGADAPPAPSEPQRSVLRLPEAGEEAVVVTETTTMITPSAWKVVPKGWKVDLVSGKASKKYEFGDFLRMSHWMGRSSALWKRLDTFPEIEWFYMGINAVLPLTPNGEVVAMYMNDQEIGHATRDTTTNGIEKGAVLWDQRYITDLQTEAESDFGWLLTASHEDTSRFVSETYVQWGHRADYLVQRKSREKKEYRQNLTLDQLMSESQQRKRRMERRAAKDKRVEEFREQYNSQENRLRTLAAAGPVGALKRRDPSGTTRPLGDRVLRPGMGMLEDEDGPSVVNDVLPREVRENLEEDSDGMDDFKATRSTAMGHHFRRNM